MPDIVRALRHPWKSLRGEIPHLTPELEGAFRFGHRVHETQRGYLLGGNMKGGSSGVWRLCTEEEFLAYQLWRDREGLLESSSDEYFLLLSQLFEKGEVEFLEGESSPFQIVPAEFSPSGGEVYQLTYQVLSALPFSHIQRESLGSFQLGGWGPDSAKGSAYQDGKVIMYSFTLKGARRPYVALLLHELGHVHENSLSAPIREELQECYSTLSETQDFVGMEYLSDSQSRKTYQGFQFEEFLAETYLAYVAWGQDLIEYIEQFAPPSQKAWKRVYRLYRETFDGVEYL